MLLFRCENESKDTCRLELKLGEINQEKDKIEFLVELLKKISHGFDAMNVSDEGNTCLSADDLNNAAFTSDNSNENEIEGNRTHPMNFFLIGDTKGVFQMLGRNGCDSSHCVL